jgi:hypothetical protein
MIQRNLSQLVFLIGDQLPINTTFNATMAYSKNLDRHRNIHVQPIRPIAGGADSAIKAMNDVEKQINRTAMMQVTHSNLFFSTCPLNAIVAYKKEPLSGVSLVVSFSIRFAQLLNGFVNAGHALHFYIMPDSLSADQETCATLKSMVNSMRGVFDNASFTDFNILSSEGIDDMSKAMAEIIQEDLKAILHADAGMPRLPFY